MQAQMTLDITKLALLEYACREAMKAGQARRLEWEQTQMRLEAKRRDAGALSHAERMALGNAIRSQLLEQTNLADLGAMHRELLQTIATELVEAIPTIK